MLHFQDFCLLMVYSLHFSEIKVFANSEISPEISRNLESKQINSKDSCFCSFVAVDPDQLVVVVVAEVEVVAVVDVVDRGGHRGSFLLKREREN